MTLSIIIPVYNVEAYLKQCLDSVLVDNQFTGQVICVNDGSTDGSLAILEQYAAIYPNVEIISQPNSGLSVARNVGLDHAMGDYVFFLDSDDWVFPGAIKKIMQLIDGEDVVYFNAERYYDETSKYGGKYDIVALTHVSGEKFFEATVHNERSGMPFVTVSGKWYKRSFLIENNLYNEPGIYHEDNYFTPLEHLVAKDVSCINEYVYVYRVRQGSITAHVTEKHIKDLLFVARKLYAKYEEQGDVPEVFYKDICQIYVNLIEKACSNALPLYRFWSYSDSRKMLRCAYDARSRKIAKLTYLSPRLAYKYMMNVLPSAIRRYINRFV